MHRFAVIVFGTAIFAGCSDNRYNHEFQLDESTFDASAMQMIEEDTGLEIPTNSKGLNFAYKPPVDPAFLARIEIPESSRAFVIRQISALKASRMNMSGGLPERVPWWHPPQGAVLIERQVFDSNNGSLLHAILTAEEGRLVLYIDWQT